MKGANLKPVANAKALKTAKIELNA